MSDHQEAHSTPAQHDDEPKTPMWLPALGAALLIAVALWWAITPSAPDHAAPDASPSASAASAASVPPPHAAPPVPTGQVDDHVQKLLQQLQGQQQGKR